MLGSSPFKGRSMFRLQLSCQFRPFLTYSAQSHICGRPYNEDRFHILYPHSPSDLIHRGKQYNSVRYKPPVAKEPVEQIVQIERNRLVQLVKHDSFELYSQQGELPGPPPSVELIYDFEELDSSDRGGERALIGVFDGHSGSTVSERLAKKLLVKLDENIRAFVEQHGAQVDIADPLTSPIVETFLYEDCVLCSYLHSSGQEGGSTALVAFVEKGNPTVTLANTGDSRCIVIREDGTTEQLTTDHKADLEVKRIEQEGGHVFFAGGTFRVNGILAMSRAFGNTELKPFVTARPEIIQYKKTKNDKFLLLATDGLFDTCSNKEIGLTFKHHNFDIHHGVGQLISVCREMKGDNVSIVCVSLDE